MKFDRRLFALLRHNQFYFAITILAGLAGGILTVLQARYLSATINLVFLGGRGLPAAIPLLSALLIWIGLRALSGWSGETAASHLAIQIKTDLRNRLYSHLNALGPAYLKRDPGDPEKRTGELVHALTEGVDSLETYFSQYLPQLALAVLVPVTFLAVIYPVDVLSWSVLLLTAPLIPVFMVLIGDRAKEMTRRQWTLLGRMSAHFLDVLQGLETLKVFNRSKAQIKVIAQVGDRYRGATMAVLRVAFLSALVLEWVATLSTAVVAVEIGLRLLYGRLTFEQAFFVLLLAPEFYLPLRQLGARFHAGMAGVEAAGRIFSILDTPLSTRVYPPSSLTPHPNSHPASRSSSASTSPLPALETSPSPSVTLGLPGSPAPRPPSLTIKDLRFSYSVDRPVFDGVSFTIPPGQTTALVGISGSGKSTLAGLLMRFIEPDAGTILVNDTPLDTVPREEWREWISWVPQDPYLFYASVAENIRLGRPGAELDELEAAARLAGAHDFIMNLPDGYDTMIGERGSRLSGGQAQRIALARAFLKDAPILILDEPAANLDPATAAEIQDVSRSLMKDRTTLIIAHQLETIAQADRILSLGDGQITEISESASQRVSPAFGGTGYSARQGGSEEANQRFSESAIQRSAVSDQRSAVGPQPLALSDQRSAVNPQTTTSGDHPSSFPTSPLSPYPYPLPSLLPRSLSPPLNLLSPFKWRVLLSVFLGWATVASGAGLLGTSAYLIAAAALHPSVAVLQVPIVAVRAFGLTRGLFRYFERLVSHDTTFRVLARLRLKFFTALEPLAPARLEEYRSADLLSRIHADVASLEEFFVRAAAPPLVWILVAITTGAFLAVYSPILAAVALFFHLAVAVALPVLVHSASNDPGRVQVAVRADLYAALVDGIQGMTDLQAFNASREQAKLVARLDQTLARAGKRLAGIAGFHSAAEYALAQLGVWSILLVGILLVQAGQLDGIYLGALTLMTLASFESAGPLPQAARTLGKNLAASRRLEGVLDAQPAVTDPENPLPRPGNHDLQVRGLDFSYPAIPPSSSNSLALQDVSFSLHPGKRLAIVGPSGSGKTTLATLLLRFWDYQDGEILLGGGDLRGYNQEDVRSTIGLVSQNTHLFNATIAENLRLARPTAGQDEIICAAQRARIHDFISSLPEGYETWIGEGGLRLSGGERQRLAIARALLKEAPILILDEPTANLDPRNEKEILRSILDLDGEVSIILITHRLVGMEEMDEILVMDAGSIVERGTHTDLMKMDGLYRRLWDLRFIGNCRDVGARLGSEGEMWESPLASPLQMPKD